MEISNEQLYALTGRAIEDFCTVLIGSGWGATGATILASIENRPSVQARLLTGASPGRNNLVLLQTTSGDWVAIANAPSPGREEVVQNVRRSPIAIETPALPIVSRRTVGDKIEFYLACDRVGSRLRDRPLKVTEVPAQIPPCAPNFGPGGVDATFLALCVWMSPVFQDGSPSQGIYWVYPESWICRVADRRGRNFLRSYDSWQAFPLPQQAEGGAMGVLLVNQGVGSVSEAFTARTGATYSKTGNFVRSSFDSRIFNPAAGAPYWEAMNLDFTGAEYAGGSGLGRGFSGFSLAQAWYDVREYPDAPPSPPDFYTDEFQVRFSSSFTGMAQGEIVASAGWSLIGDSAVQCATRILPPMPGQPPPTPRANQVQAFVTTTPRNRSSLVTIAHVPSCTRPGVMSRYEHFEVTQNQIRQLRRPHASDWRKAYFRDIDNSGLHPCILQAAANSYAHQAQASTRIAKIDPTLLAPSRETPSVLTILAQTFEPDQTNECILSAPPQSFRSPRLPGWGNLDSQPPLESAAAAPVLQ